MGRLKRKLRERQQNKEKGRCVLGQTFWKRPRGKIEGKGQTAVKFLEGVGDKIRP